MPDNRRKWHQDRSFNWVNIGMFLIALAGASAAFVLWFGDQQTRLSDEEMASEVLAKSIEDAKTASVQGDAAIRKDLAEINERWRAALREQERRTERRYDRLKKELQAVRELLEQIALNTNRAREV